MSRLRHYTPPLSRFLVCALHHKAKRRGVAMTTLLNQIVGQALIELPGWNGWKEAEKQLGRQET